MSNKIGSPGIPSPPLLEEDWRGPAEASREPFPQRKTPRRNSEQLKQFDIFFSFNNVEKVRIGYRVLSRGKRGKVFQYLFLKLLFDQLSKDELICFLSFPETTGNPVVTATLRLLSTGASKKKLRDVLERLGKSFTGFELSKKRYKELLAVKPSLTRVLKPVNPTFNKKKGKKSNSRVGRGSSRTGYSPELQRMIPASDCVNFNSIFFFLEDLVERGNTVSSTLLFQGGLLFDEQN
jgi:hypothetical protein